jgi:hypothetical protein
MFPDCVYTPLRQMWKLLSRSDPEKPSLSASLALATSFPCTLYYLLRVFVKQYGVTFLGGRMAEEHATPRRGKGKRLASLLPRCFLSPSSFYLSFRGSFAAQLTESSIMPYIIEEEHQDPWGPCPHEREPLSEFVEDMKTSANKEVFLSDNQRRFDAAIAITPRGVRNAVCEYINRHYRPPGYDPYTMRMGRDTLAWYQLMGWIQCGSRSFRIRRRSQSAGPQLGENAVFY